MVDAIDLNFENNTTPCIKTSFVFMDIGSSSFKNNLQAINLSGESYLMAVSLKIIKCLSGYGPGGIYLINKSTFDCTNCEFRENTGYPSAVIYAEQDSKIILENVIFDSNPIASDNTIKLTSSIEISEFKNCTFTNASSQESIIIVNSVSLEINSLRCTDNNISIYTNDANVNILNSEISNNRYIILRNNKLPILDVTNHSNITIYNTTFQNLSVSQGESFRIISSTLTMTSCTVTNFTASSLRSIISTGSR
jgi:hypothetical protein